MSLMSRRIKPCTARRRRRRGPWRPFGTLLAVLATMALAPSLATAGIS